MNTELTDRLDDQMRALMRTAVEHSTKPPTLDDIEIGVGLRAAPTVEPSHPVRWLAVAAVLLLALAGGLVWSVRNDPATPANQPAVTDDRVGLGAYVLPATLPPGWRMVDVVETAADNVGVASPREWTIEALDGSVHAVLAIFPASSASNTSGEVTATTAPTTARGADGTWSVSYFSNTAMLLWTERGQDVMLDVAGHDETRARALRAELRPDTDSNGLVYSLPADSSYRIGRDLGSVPLMQTGGATVTLLDGENRVGTIGLNRSNDWNLNVLLDPTIVGAPPDVHVDADTGSLVGSMERDGMSVIFYSNGDVKADEVSAVLAGLTPVEPSAWDAAIDEVEARLEAQPVAGSATVADGTLTFHQQSGLTSVCFRRGAERACHTADPLVGRGGSLVDLSLSMIVGGRWVLVQGVDVHDAAGPVTVDHDGSESGLVTTQLGTFAVVVAPPGVDEMKLTIGTPGASLFDGVRMVRPIH